MTTRFRITQTRVARLLLVLLMAVLLSSPGRAHEGHAPLPAKGIEVDVKKGLLTLSRAAQNALGVQTVRVEELALQEQALAYATLVAPWQDQYFVSSRLSGRIIRLHVKAGDRVSTGQLLAEIASPELEVVQLEYRDAVNSFDLSQKQLESAKALAAKGAIAERVLIEAANTEQKNRNAVSIARSKLEALELDTAAIEQLTTGDAAQSVTFPIKSPIDGTVNHLDLAVGKVVAANEHLFEVSDLSTVWVRIGVLERDIRHIKIGQPVELELTAYPGESISTTITALGHFVDADSHLATVWAEISNPTENEPRFLPGMYGLARIVTSPPTKFLTIPSAALLGTGAERYVLVEVAATARGNEYRRQNVVIVAQNAKYVQIRGGGLYPGDRVVTSGGHILSSSFVLGVLRLSPEGIKNSGLRVEPAVARVIDDVLEFDGQIDLPPERRAAISSPLGGILHRVLVDRGETVKAGQIIAEIVSLELQETQRELIRAHLDVELLDATLKRLQKVENIVAARRIWETESELNAAINRRDSARRTLLTQGLSDAQLDAIIESRRALAALPLRSPIDGVVVRFDKVLGELIETEEPLLEVQDLSHPWVEGFLSEREAGRIRIGMPARVRLVADPSFVADATIVRSARTVSGENRTLAVWVEFDAPPSQPLERHLLVRVSATLQSGAATLAVPNSAVIREGTRAYVFVQGKNSVLDRRFVELGRADDRFVEIRKGLKKGELVAAQGAAELQTTYASVR